MKNFALIHSLFILLLMSCNSNKEDFDTIINTYDKEDFSCLKNTFINSRGAIYDNNVVLLISKDSLKCSPYIVTINYKTKEVLKIDKKLALKDCYDYFSEKEIKTLVKCFFRYNFEVIEVDQYNNVYINPYHQDMPVLVRKDKMYDRNKLKHYKLYKGDWYVKK